jgi:hypothetical protein
VKIGQSRRSATAPSGIENSGNSHGILLVGSNSKQFSLLYQPAGKLPTCVADPVLVMLRRYPGIVKHSVLSTTPTAEAPALSDEERLERRRRFIERVFSPDGLDRDTLEHIEQLTGEER